jgi:glycosyltransferase involved in cell wall biosynthesis
MAGDATSKQERPSRELAPRVSIGVPVRNGEKTIGRLLECLLAQTFGDFEVIVCDNASQDATARIVQEYAGRDARIRCYRNPVNIGQIANFNKVFELSRGEYFRWIGCNDWLAPHYLERCVAALDASPRAIMVTTYQKHIQENGTTLYAEHTGPRVDDPRPDRRFCRMIWFLRASPLYLDPIYSMVRSDVLRRTKRLRPVMGTDMVLALELSLLGPLCHVPECLSYRQVTRSAPIPVLLKRYDPQLIRVRGFFLRTCWTMGQVVLDSPMGLSQKIICLGAVLGYYLRWQWRRIYLWGRSRFALRSRVRRLLGKAPPAAPAAQPSTKEREYPAIQS